MVIEFDEEGNYSIDKLIEAQNLMDVLDDLDYDTNLIDKALKYRIEESEQISTEEKRELLGKLYLYLSENSYLKTIQAIKENDWTFLVSSKKILQLSRKMTLPYTRHSSFFLITPDFGHSFFIVLHTGFTKKD